MDKRVVHKLTSGIPVKQTRKVKPIDWEKVDRLLLAGCPGTEICPHFDMHPDTFYLRVQEEKGMGFSEYCQIKRCEGLSNLREAQYDEAINKRDRAMLIFLGKVRLDQKENNYNVTVSPEINKKYDEVMSMLDSIQDTRKTDAINESIDT